MYLTEILSDFKFPSPRIFDKHYDQFKLISM